MATSLIKALWARLSGKVPAQGTLYFGEQSQDAQSAVLYDREDNQGIASVGCGVSGRGKQHPGMSKLRTQPVEYAMTATGSAVPVLDLPGELASNIPLLQAETILRAASMTLLERIGTTVKAIGERYPLPARSAGMSKADSYVALQETASQELKQADAAAELSSAFSSLGDSVLATAMAEWAGQKRLSAQATKRHLEDPEYLAWLEEPEQGNE